MSFTLLPGTVIGNNNSNYCDYIGTFAVSNLLGLFSIFLAAVQNGKGQRERRNENELPLQQEKTVYHHLWLSLCSYSCLFDAKWWASYEYMLKMQQTAGSTVMVEKWMPV